MLAGIMGVQRKIQRQMQKRGAAKGREDGRSSPNCDAKRQTPKDKTVVDGKDRLPGVRIVKLAENGLGGDAHPPDRYRDHQIERNIRRERPQKCRRKGASLIGFSKGRRAKQKMGWRVQGSALFDFAHRQGALNFLPHQLADIARDPLAQIALKLFADQR